VAISESPAIRATPLIPDPRAIASPEEQYAHRKPVLAGALPPPGGGIA
jgi:hypothetical protein